MAIADSSDDAAIPQPGGDPVLTLLQRLTREGTIIAAFASVHEKFHRYHHAALGAAGSAISDSRALEQLRDILNEFLTLFHEHHAAEEDYLFPALRRVDPVLDPVVDQLRLQHERLTELTSLVQSQVDAINETNIEDGVPGLVQSLTSLHELVIEHLAFEEAVTVPVVSTWTRWPS